MHLSRVVTIFRLTMVVCLGLMAELYLEVLGIDSLALLAASISLKRTRKTTFFKKVSVFLHHAMDANVKKHFLFIGL